MGPMGPIPELPVENMCGELKKHRNKPSDSGRPPAGDDILPAVLSVLNGLVLILDGRGVALACKTPADVCVRFVHFPPEALAGKAIQEIFPEPVSQQISKAADAARQTGGPVRFEYAMEIGGGVSSFSATLSSAGEADQDPFILIVRDETRLKKAETALKSARDEFQKMLASMEKYTSILDSIEEGYYEVDLAGNFMFFNHSLQKILGYSESELMGLNNRTYMTEATAREVYKTFNEVYRTGKTSKAFDWELICRDGASRIVETSVSLIRGADNAPRGFFGVARDVTERKQAEEALRESEERFRAALEANPDPVILYDMTGKVLFFNPAFTRVFGWTLDECQGRKMDMFVPEDAWPETTRMIRTILAGEKLSATETWRFNRSGEKIPVLISGSIFRNREGDPAGSIINIRDVSDQKRLQNQFLQAQRMEAIGTLAGGIAHDFNNLLMAIQGNASLVRMGLDPEDAGQKKLENIEKYVQHGSDLTRQLLGFARAGKYEVKPMNLNEVIKNSAKMFKRTRKEITVHTRLEKDVRQVEADRSQMEQVMVNLFVNAAQAMPGGGTLSIASENVILDSRFVAPYNLPEGNYVKISVIDTGSGMDEKTKSRIFDPFFTTRERGRGTGLGLASVYGIVKNHNGVIHVDSEVGKGTAFHIYLPSSQATQKAAKNPPDDILAGSETVLLVDDEEMIIEVGEEMLTEMGYDAMVARSGTEAVATYREHKDRIALVILDIIMPDMGGGEVYDRLLEIDPAVKAILASGYSIDGKAADILDRGCDGFIQKPFTMAQLSQKIREVLDGV